MHRLLANRAGFVLGTVSLGLLPLSALSGIAHLTTQLFRYIQKSAPKKLLRRGLDFFVHFLWDDSFFFDFGDV